MLDLEEQESKEVQQTQYKWELVRRKLIDMGLRAFGKGMRTLNRDGKF